MLIMHINVVLLQVTYWNYLDVAIQQNLYNQIILLISLKYKIDLLDISTGFVKIYSQWKAPEILV